MSGNVVSTACSRLMEADQAYHDLMRGAAIRSITDENGENQSYTQANRDSLLQYIRLLSPQCPTYVPTALGLADPTRRAIGFFF